MGQGAASLGEAYVRLENEDMDATAVWENFPVHRIVGAMGDSSSGGTAIATGCQSKQGYVALNLVITSYSIHYTKLYENI